MHLIRNCLLFGRGLQLVSIILFNKSGNRWCPGGCRQCGTNVHTTKNIPHGAFFLAVDQITFSIIIEVLK
jgi:hypothetical protein